MKQINSILLKPACVLFLIFAIQACDSEFSEIGTGIVGIPDFEIENKFYPVKTYNQRITPFQSDGLVNNLLGYYNDPVFGSSNINFVGQLIPKSLSPNFGDNVELDSVVLTIPYHSTTREGEDGGTEYELDSLYGTKPVKLSIYKNNFLLRDFDPSAGIDDAQSYYSDGSLTFGQSIETAQLEGQLLYYEADYFPSDRPKNLKTYNEETDAYEVTSTLTPSLRVHLYNNPTNSSPSEEFWEDLILSKEEDAVLSSLNSFKEYFRGLYIKTEPWEPQEGHMMQLNFSSADSNLKLHYTYEKTTTVNGVDDTTTNQGVYELGFSGNKVSLFENYFNPSVLQSIEDSSITSAGVDYEGADYLYLKGGEGSMAIIELFADDEFGNTYEDYLNEFRVQNNGQTTVKRLINEAFLEFYIEETLYSSDLPNRVYLYDLENNIPVADYFLDQTVNTASADSKYNHLVPLATETDSEGNTHKKYKVRLTEHLNNIIARDSTNVKLGLVVSSNVGAANTKKLQTINQIEGIPSGTILSPKSIILYGNNSPNLNKNAKLNIYYTEPNN